MYCVNFRPFCAVHAVEAGSIYISVQLRCIASCRFIGWKYRWHKRMEVNFLSFIKLEIPSAICENISLLCKYIKLVSSVNSSLFAIKYHNTRKLFNHPLGCSNQLLACTQLEKKSRG